MMAASQGQEEVVSLLLSRGADANLRDTEGRSARVLAEQAGHDSVVIAFEQQRKSKGRLFRLF